jgi:hypothetical protein
MNILYLNFELVACPWRRGLVVQSPLAIEETGTMGREIESLVEALKNR